MDPDNDLFWRFDMRRLSAEEVRDSLLAVSGSLNRQVYGRSFYEKLSPEVLAGQSRPGNGWGESSRQERNRRSVYIHVKRSLLTPILEQFDLPSPDSTCPVRFATTQPTQALGMLNSEFLSEQSAAFAERLRREAPGGVRDQVTLGLRLAVVRAPAKVDVDDGVELIEDLQKQGASAYDALKYFCLFTLNLNEFVFLD